MLTVICAFCPFCTERMSVSSTLTVSFMLVSDESVRSFVSPVAAVLPEEDEPSPEESEPSEP